MINKKLIKKFDWFLFILIIFLVIVGLVAISSATNVDDTGDFSFVKKQIVWFIIGCVAIAVIISFDYNNICDFAIYLYIIGILMLVAVLIFGTRINGAKSWFVFKGISMQPSEFVKIICIISLSKHIQKIKEKSNDFGIEDGLNNIINILVLLVHVGIPVVLIMKQPDWGTAAVFLLIMFSILFVAGISFKYIIGAVGAAIVIFPLLFLYVMDEYQKNRFISFLNPEADPLGTGYHVIQSKIAIGSGKLFGKGLYNGPQTQMGYLPEQQTDFIFSVIGEELGFIWTSIIISVYIIILIRMLYLATKSKDELGSYIMTGIAVMIFSHVLINVGMTIGLLPVMGIPLPFISYGGSSLLTNMVAIGLILNITMRRKRLNFE